LEMRSLRKSSSIQHCFLVRRLESWLTRWSLSSREGRGNSTLGMLNSRMKDFFDVWFLAKTFPFDPGKLSEAVAATFSRRGTQWDIAKLEELLAALGSDQTKTLQWRAFLRKSSLAAPVEFSDVTNAVRVFLRRHVGDGNSATSRRWRRAANFSMEDSAGTGDASPLFDPHELRLLPGGLDDVV